MAYVAQAIKESRASRASQLDPETTRALYLLRVAALARRPRATPTKRAELAEIAARLEGIYGKGKYCGKDGKAKTCQDLEELSRRMREEPRLRRAARRVEGLAHDLAADARASTRASSSSANEGAREIGFEDVGELWRSGYDMTPDAFEAETERLWKQVKPLYDAAPLLRARAAREDYGKDKVPADRARSRRTCSATCGRRSGATSTRSSSRTRARPSLDVDAALEGEEARRASDGRSSGEALLHVARPRPAARDVLGALAVHEAARTARSSATRARGTCTFDNDLRIKMCIKPNEEDLITIHHELGHDYYFHAYYKLPMLFQRAPTTASTRRSATRSRSRSRPRYLKKIGLLDEGAADDEKGAHQRPDEEGAREDRVPAVRQAHRPVALGRVLAGRRSRRTTTRPGGSCARKYQGVAPPVARTEADFDPGAKYHVPANVPYMRYFLARMLQFQFHRALCKAAGHKGPLHECSIYGNKEAGEKLQAMLALGATKPWPEALQAITGEREVDATAILEYFAPLAKWLKEQNQGQKCGW